MSIHEHELGVLGHFFKLFLGKYPVGSRHLARVIVRITRVTISGNLYCIRITVAI